jgi:hypothetical protein
MACINIKNPEYIALSNSLSNYGLTNQGIIQAYIHEYQEETNSDNYPDISYFSDEFIKVEGDIATEQPSLFIYKGDNLVGHVKLENTGDQLIEREVNVYTPGRGIGSFAYTKIAEMASQQGFQFRSDDQHSVAGTNLWESLVRQDKAEKLSGVYYYKQQENKQSNQEQLSVVDQSDITTNFEQDINQVDKNFEKLLINRLSEFNVKVDIIEDMQKAYGIDSLGIVDILHKIIHVAATRNYDTLSEPAAHMLVGMVGTSDKHISKLYDLIDKWSKYEGIKNEYLSKYNNNEDSIKILAIGKLISESINQVYDNTKGDQALLAKAREALEAIINYIIHAFGITRKIDDVADKYISKLSEKVAIDFLSGDMVTEFKTIPEGYSLINYENAFNRFPNAKRIHDTIVNNSSAKLTGSLALSLQGSVYRTSDEPIHDLDYVINITKSNEIEKLVNIFKLEGAIDSHFGIVNGDIKTISILIPEKGYKIIPKKRIENSDSRWNGYVEDFDIITPYGNNIGPDSSKLLNIDFFLVSGPEKSYKNVNSWDLIFKGKKTISNKSPQLFGRLKDSRDFINFEQYFPDYSYLNGDERQVFIKGVESGDITITCTK